MLHLTLTGKQQTIAVLYNSLHELPAHRWKEMQKWLIVESGIGGDLHSIDKHHQRLMVFLEAGKLNDAQNEMLLLRNNYFLLLQGIKPKWKAFACLVARMDGVDCDDLSEEGLDRVLARLSEYHKVSGPLIEQTLDDIKKNWIPNEKPLTPSALTKTLKSV